ncbi:desiccation-related protein PCC13-62-like [Cucurbita pepo subsp. pepo]|uniref:desiccation-related protein PCC13-62-like n=1 Tax=Cucurbita pepo subsp. pepo TaxID=3664 RepID=UPI000C9D74D5|nr:desiccation-related protein PCC13-62-like [Cucurbita pepo subsp. pepo]
MRNPSFFSILFFVVALAFSSSRVVVCQILGQCRSGSALDSQVIVFATNFEYLEGEMFLWGALGRGMDSIDPTLARGGPPPIGAQRANLDPIVRNIIEEFGYEEIGQLKTLIQVSGGLGIQRPLLNLSKDVFSDLFDKAAGRRLSPPFDPYVDTIHFLLAVNLFPYLGYTGLVEAAPLLLFLESRKLAAKLLSAESGQSAVMRTLLYERANETVEPYNMTVAEFTNLTSTLANQLGKCGLKDEGVVVPRSLGAENRTETNVLATDAKSLSYNRTIQEILRILYGTGSERLPGAFFPNGANGSIARRFLRGGII